MLVHAVRLKFQNVQTFASSSQLTIQEQLGCQYIGNQTMPMGGCHSIMITSFLGHSFSGTRPCFQIYITGPIG